MIPICRTLWLLILSTAAAGFSVGILDTATNVQLIAIHGKKVKKEDYLSCFVILYVFVVQVSIASAPEFGSKGLGSIPSQGHCVMFLSKTPHSHNACFNSRLCR